MQRPDLLTSLMNMSLVLRLPGEIHLGRSSANVPRLPPFLEGVIESIAFYIATLLPTEVLLGCWTAFGAVCWQPTGLIGVAGPPLGQYVGDLQVLLGCVLATDKSYWGLLGCMLATYRSHGRCWTAFGAVCWRPTSLIVSVMPSCQLARIGLGQCRLGSK